MLMTVVPCVSVEVELDADPSDISLGDNMLDDKEAVDRLDIGEEVEEYGLDVLNVEVGIAAGTEPDVGIPARILS